jgi:hypothetical protein
VLPARRGRAQRLRPNSDHEGKQAAGTAQRFSPEIGNGPLGPNHVGAASAAAVAPLGGTIQLGKSGQIVLGVAPCGHLTVSFGGRLIAEIMVIGVAEGRRLVG